MIRKLTLAAAFGAGYVLGAKAGTQRYDQIAAGAQKLASKPPVQKATDKAAAAASDVADQASTKASGVADKAVDKVNEVVAQADQVASDVKDGARDTTAGDVKDKAAALAADASSTLKDAVNDKAADLNGSTSGRVQS